MTLPEAYHDDKHGWFKIDGYSTSESSFTSGQTFFYRTCESQKASSVFGRDQTSLDNPEYAPTALVALARVL